MGQPVAGQRENGARSGEEIPSRPAGTEFRKGGV